MNTNIHMRISTSNFHTVNSFSTRLLSHAHLDESELSILNTRNARSERSTRMSFSSRTVFTVPLACVTSCATAMSSAETATTMMASPTSAAIPSSTPTTKSNTSQGSPVKKPQSTQQE